MALHRFIRGAWILLALQSFNLSAKEQPDPASSDPHSFFVLGDIKLLNVADFILACSLDLIGLYYGIGESLSN